MCGRTACTLDPETLCKACSYKDASNVYKRPQWKDHPSKSNSGDSYKYYPSANIMPSKFTPILMADSASGERFLMPALWGLVPIWHKGENAKNHGLTTNNCRLEGVKESRLYKLPLAKRQNCVIICQGFYEWKTVGYDPKKSKAKQPFFIYMPQEQDKSIVEKKKISDDELWTKAEWNEDEGWKGPKLLMMAGFYDKWESSDGEIIYSYTIITMDSQSTNLSEIHDRIPCILKTPEEVESWLNPKPDMDVDAILKVLEPIKKLEMYTVSTKVNNSRCHDMDCNKYQEIKKTNTLDSWLKKTKKEGNEEKETDIKKPKLE